MAYNSSTTELTTVYISEISRPAILTFGNGDQHDKWVPVTTAWRVLRLRMEERPTRWTAAANILNKQSRAADKG